MKVIDLLNKIANGEEVPKKIKIGECEKIFEWSGRIYAYTYKKEDGFSDVLTPDYLYVLNKEIEIIEEPQEHKIPEKLKLYKLSDNDSANISTLQDFNNRNIQITINEILDYLEEIK